MDKSRNFRTLTEQKIARLEAIITINRSFLETYGDDITPEYKQNIIEQNFKHREEIEELKKSLEV